ncbi:unknown [Orgyia pseudotsugata multiple nucleopolyhedrovirus]|uniref:Uncharacterized protein n=1 Tax=Orgyia pseudotsugata multicapsid polyhedrosis virus TaxID=262177 RepID=O10321_NPVOP|nr:hypothetical protein OpmnVgp067 [Orgyia pseudotsugata multiple nucleopolyhedrovirus]AAC59066.1 unknown [Orgyia pseudotsugata multiple nucleopolyhedrovirus]
MDTDEIQEEKILDAYKRNAAEKEEKIQSLTTMDTNQQVVKFANASIVANEKLMAANNSLKTANENLAHMANRMADIAQE